MPPDAFVSCSIDQMQKVVSGFCAEDLTGVDSSEHAQQVLLH